MATEASKFKVGLFVTFGLAAAIVGLVVLGAARFLQRTERIITYFDESVQGLDKGSAVKFRGVPVGRVSSIYVASHDDLVAVEIEIFPEVFTDESGKPIPRFAYAKMLQEFINEGLRVRLSLAGITGLKYLELDTLDAAKHPVPKLDFKPPYHWVPSVPSKLKGLEIDITKAVSRLAHVDFEGIGDGIKKAVDHVSSLLGTLDYKKLAKQLEDLLAGTQAAVAEVKTLASRLDTTIANAKLDQVFKDTGETVRTLRDAARRLEQQITPVLAQFKEALKSLETTGARASAAAATIDKQLGEADIPGTARSMRNAFDQSATAAEKIASLRDDARRVLRELDASLRTMRRFLDYMERDPNAVFAGKREPGR